MYFQQSEEPNPVGVEESEMIDQKDDESDPEHDGEDHPEDDPANDPQTDPESDGDANNDESMDHQQSEIGENPEPMITESNLVMDIRFIDVGFLVWKDDTTFEQFKRASSNVFKLVDKERRLLSVVDTAPLYSNKWLWLLVEDSFGLLTLRGCIRVTSVEITADYVKIFWMWKCFTYQSFHINPTGIYLTSQFIPHLWSSHVSYDVITAFNQVRQYVCYYSTSFDIVCETGKI